MIIQKIYILISTNKQESRLVSPEEGKRLIECGFKHKVKTRVTFYGKHNYIQQTFEHHYIYVDNINYVT